MGLFNRKKNRPLEKPVEIKQEPLSSDLEGDRGLYNVKGKSKKGAKKFIVLFIALAIILLGAIAGSMAFLKMKKPQEVAQVSLSDKEQYSKENAGSNALAQTKGKVEKTLNQMMNDVSTENEEAAPSESEAPPQKTAAIEIEPEPTTETRGNSRDKVLTPQERRLQGEVLIAQNVISKPEKKETDLNQPLDKRHVNKSESDFLKGASFADGNVGFIRDREYLLSAGTSMPCVLKTKIVTSYPAVVMCQLTKNVYSDDGKTVLLRGGALLQGEQTRVLQQGVARVFVNWSTVKDGNIRVRIDALGADGLGASGLPAWVDNHFWERFGGAIMLSFIDDALAAAASHASKENSSVTVDNTRNTAGNMAELALENSINIPPTAYVNQGEMLTVIVPRNVDFSSVFKVE
ncbi:TrbI/VirB10 family protein [Providencia alcalifaciens]|uniref:TrbI/VirB10 family protein n=1 Tax=Providencia alcalifaciens TaxID=126385 RepID=UPI002B055970|nr:TrbI/VirB10 family protein [Providencia alcalifaciens]